MDNQPLTPAHFHAFGFLIIGYARCEVALKLMLGGVLKLEPWQVSILAEPYGALDLQNVARHIFKEADIPEPVREKLLSFVGELKSFSALRNDIAHSIWVPGRRPNSVKPASLSIRGNQLKFRGLGADETDFTVDGIRNRARELGNLHKRMWAFIQEHSYPELPE